MNLCFDYETTDKKYKIYPCVYCASYRISLARDKTINCLNLLYYLCLEELSDKLIFIISLISFSFSMLTHLFSLVIQMPALRSHFISISFISSVVLFSPKMYSLWKE